MNETIIYRFKHLSMWSKEGQPALHKPILLLYALAGYQRGKTTFLFEKEEAKWNDLLIKYGKVDNPRPEYPFVRLVSDGIWNLNGNINWQPNQDYSRRVLIDNKVSGGFTDEVLEELKDDRTLQHIAKFLLGTYFDADARTQLVSEIGLKLD